MRPKTDNIIPKGGTGCYKWYQAYTQPSLSSEATGIKATRSNSTTTIEVFRSIGVRDQTRHRSALKEISWRRSCEVVGVQVARFLSSEPLTPKWPDSAPSELNLCRQRPDPQRTPCEK
ncbi:hypothetical protein TIFTF001_024862 [Ficus carica]|uniref:Uncharacterized protein n=1 Tax=Ficus carica TaxID=3494 RepID=A0AA88DDQ4_FICCA|nr:hypothetical protein TIFTF001_024862 [Ficus carica]